MSTQEAREILDAEQIATSLMRVVPELGRLIAMQLRQSTNGLLPAHFAVLHSLQRGPHAIGELADKLRVSVPTMSNSVNTLVQHNWVARVRDANDRRRVLVELTVEGHSVMGDMLRITHARLAELIAPLSEAERVCVSSGLDVLLRCLSQTEPELLPGHGSETSGQIE